MLSYPRNLHPFSGRDSLCWAVEEALGLGSHNRLVAKAARSHRHGPQKDLVLPVDCCG